MGEEQQGKTSLLKNILVEALKRSIPVVYIDGESIKTSKILDVVSNNLSKMYDDTVVNDVFQPAEKIILLDNIDKIPLNTTNKNKLFGEIDGGFDFVIATCNESCRYLSTEFTSLVGYAEYSLMGFGNLKREEIIKKWLSIGVSETIDERDLYRDCDEMKDRLNAVIKKNIVPSKPIYVLMLLQIFEAYAQQKLDLTSYGHCYQSLIYKSLESAKINSNDFSKYLNILTELSWYILKAKSSLNNHQKEKFILGYESVFLSDNTIASIEILRKHHILKMENDLLGFKYPYIYYFFVGKKIAENYSNDAEIKNATFDLLQNLHREDYANILVFITHHTKDSWILNEIQAILKKLFVDQKEANLSRNELGFMSDFIEKIPELVLEQREIGQERDHVNKKLDEFERESADESSYETDTEIMSNINRAFKGMEICGQIIKNRHANIPKDMLVDLAEDGIHTGLRFLTYFIEISDASKEELVRVIQKCLLEQPDIANRAVEIHAKHVYHMLTYGVIAGVVKKISESIGCKEAIKIYSILENKHPTPAVILIKACIEMRFNRNLDVDAIEKIYHGLKTSPVCARILRETVIQHTYMYPSDYQTRQKISTKLKIPIDKQRKMEQKPLIKPL